MKFFFISLFFGVLCLIASSVLFKMSDWTSFKRVISSVNMNEKMNFNFSFNSDHLLSSKKVETSKSYSLHDVKGINVEGSVGKVEVVKSASEKIEVYLSYPEEAKWLELSSFKIGEVIYIKSIKKEEAQDRKKDFKDGVRVRIACPEVKALDLNFNLLLGAVSVSDVNLKSLNVKLMLGGFKSKNVKVSNDVFVSAQAGDIKLKSLEAKRLDIEAAAGNIEIGLISETPQVNARADVGRVIFKLDESFAKNYKLKASTSFGSVDVAGDYLYQEGVYIFGEGEGRVNLNASMGVISVL